MVAVLGTEIDVRVVARDPGHARTFAGEAMRDGVHAHIHAASAEEAVRGADVVITATSSPTPVFSGRDLAEGAHVTAVGSFKPTMRELDDETLRGARIVVDQRRPALAEAGELQGLRAADVVEIGEVIAGTVPGRRSPSERTIFKSVGNAIQDLVVASRAYERALEMGIGEEIAWP
jgi:ornithine cyclodeaminase